MLNISANQPLRAKENRGSLLPETLSDDDRKVLKSLAEVLDIFMLERPISLSITSPSCSALLWRRDTLRSSTGTG
jgi:hypothetical protein